MIEDMRRHEEKARQRALWCECQAEKWRLKGWDDLADAYERRAADWRAEAERWKARRAREGRTLCGAS